MSETIGSYSGSNTQTSPSSVDSPISVDLLKNCLRNATEHFLFMKADTETLLLIKQYVESYLRDNLLTLKLCKTCATPYLPVLVDVKCEYRDAKTSLQVAVFYPLGHNVYSVSAMVVW